MIYSKNDLGQLSEPKKVKTKEYVGGFIYMEGEDCNKPLYQCPILFETFNDLGNDRPLRKTVEEACNKGKVVVIRKITIQE